MHGHRALPTLLAPCNTVSFFHAGAIGDPRESREAHATVHVKLCISTLCIQSHHWNSVVLASWSRQLYLNNQMG